jgi:hypothetical protein
MQYYEDMTSKYGFNDGNYAPAGIDKYRDVYVRAINAVAESLGSKHRVVPFDREGCHNSYLIVPVYAEWFNEFYMSKQKDGFLLIPADEFETDKTEVKKIYVEEEDMLLTDAINIAQEMQLDDWIECTVSKKAGFGEWLNNKPWENTDENHQTIGEDN